ncbi:MAG: membrane integrity-associated transporter subunit PqiC [Gammaproteobacteria bacterium]|nr:membrane integrity-associated transporter subunit PqiC [Gammaproteobacteria bacterium]
MISLRRRAFALMGVVMLALGCAGAGSPQTRYYLLPPPPAVVAEALDREGIRLQIRSLELPHYLDRSQLVSREGEGESVMVLAETEQWGGSLRGQIASFVVLDLMQKIGSAQVALAPDRLPGRVDLSLELEILRFERGSDQRVHLTAQWRLLRGESLLRFEVTPLHGSRTVGRQGLAGVAGEMGVLLQQFTSVVAAAVVAESERLQ